MAQFLFKSTPKTTLHGPLGGDIKTELKNLKFKPPVTVFNGFLVETSHISHVPIAQARHTGHSGHVCYITPHMGHWWLGVLHVTSTDSNFKIQTTSNGFLNSNQPYPHCRRTSQGTQDTTALCAISPKGGLRWVGCCKSHQHIQNFEIQTASNGFFGFDLP